MVDVNKDNEYQKFVCDALGVERCQDVACLAEADKFCRGTLEQVKIGAGYAVAAFNVRVINGNFDDNFDGNNYLKSIINATSKDDIYDVIVKYKNKVVHKYFSKGK